jgi:hypothetical protein
MTADIHLMCEVPATVNIYRAECIAGLILTHISSKYFLFLISLSLTQKKQQRTFGYRKKNEAVDLVKIDIYLAESSICARA